MLFSKIVSRRVLSHPNFDLNRKDLFKSDDARRSTPKCGGIKCCCCFNCSILVCSFYNSSTITPIGTCDRNLKQRDNSSSSSSTVHVFDRQKMITRRQWFVFRLSFDLIWSQPSHPHFVCVFKNRKCSYQTSVAISSPHTYKIGWPWVHQQVHTHT